MRYFLFALLTMGAVSTTARSEPVAPSNPVELSSEVGSAACEDGKVVVHEKATVTRKSVTYHTVLETHGGFGGDVDLDNDALSGLIDALTATIAKPDTDYLRKIGDVTISNKEKESKRIVSIVQDRKNSVTQGSIALDTDNAATLVKLLKKSQGVQEWMKDKAIIFQK